MKIPLSKIQRISHTDFDSIELFIKRDDQIDDNLSGNKLYKLIYNLERARSLGYMSILTLGGAYSNHIAATASMCHSAGFQSIGIIRGERPKNINPTLAYAKKCGMRLQFISREDYRKKDEKEQIEETKLQHPDSFLIPEGGSNLLGILGAKRMVDERTNDFDYIITAIGTGTTFAGLVKAAKPEQCIVGIPIHKHDRIIDDILKIYPSFQLQMQSKARIVNGYHCGGYAKWDISLVNFIGDFYSQTKIKLDPIYTGKAMMAIKDLVKTNRIEPNSKVLFIHTGGIQGVKGFEERFKLKLFYD